MSGGYQAYGEYKESGVEWLGDIPKEWTVSRTSRFFKVSMGQTILKEDLDDGGQWPVYSATEDDKFFGYINKAVVKLHKGDLVIPARGNSIGSVKLVSEPATTTQTTIYCKHTSRKLDSVYAFYYMVGCRNYLFWFTQTAIPQITVEQVGTNTIVVPSISVQKNIAAFLDHETAKIDTLIEKQNQLIELLKEKRQAVISHAVTKGLDPHVPMKDSGVEWLGDVPEHWEMKRLNYLGNVRNGLTYSPENITDEDSGILVLRSSNIQDSSLCFNDNVYVDSKVPEQFLVKVNDLLICSRNGSRKLIGKNALINKSAEGTAFGAFMAVFRSDINAYIFWVLNSPLFEYQSGSFLTSTINQLTIGNLNSMEIPVPPIKEQIEIEKYLSRKNHDLTKLISKIEKSISLLQERRTALISAAVTGKIDVRNWRALQVVSESKIPETTA